MRVSCECHAFVAWANFDQVRGMTSSFFDVTSFFVTICGQTLTSANVPVLGIVVVHFFMVHGRRCDDT